MKNSLCAHCIHANEIANQGKAFESKSFVCSYRSSDNGEYEFCANRRISDGCEYFENDADQFNKALEDAKKFEITKDKWVTLYDYLSDMIIGCSNVLRDRYNGVDISPYEYVEREARNAYFSIQSIMIELTSYPTTYPCAWRSLVTKLVDFGKSDDDATKQAVDSVLSKMGEIERMESD